MELDQQQLENILEAILFSCGEPIEVDKLAKALETDDFTVAKLLKSLGARLEREGGIELRCYDGERYQLTSKKYTAPYVRRAMEIHRDIPLSPAAFEVLAVIAYRQPVTRAYVEQIRGVDCSAVITTLVAKSLVEEKGRMDLPGRPLLYGTTDNFLRCFNLSSLSQLPALEDIEMDVGDSASEPEEQLKIQEV